jgi:hypothetical protein
MFTSNIHKEKFFFKGKKTSENVIQQIIADARHAVSTYKDTEFFDLAQEATIIKLITKSLYSQINSTHEYIFEEKFLIYLSTIFGREFYLSPPYLKIHNPGDSEEAGPYHIDARKGAGKTFTLWDPFVRPIGNQRLKVMFASHLFSKIPLAQNLLIKFCHLYPKLIPSAYIDLKSNESLIFDANIIHKGNINDGKNTFLTTVLRISEFPYAEGGYCKVSLDKNNRINLIDKYYPKYQKYTSDVISDLLALINKFSLESPPKNIIQSITEIYSHENYESNPLKCLASNFLLDLATYTKINSAKISLMFYALKLNRESADAFYNLLVNFSSKSISELCINLINKCHSPSILITLGNMVGEQKFAIQCYNKAHYLENIYIKND